MTSTDLDHFRARGCLLLAGFHPTRQLLPVRREVLDALARSGAWGGGKRRPHPLHAMPPFQQIARLSAAIRIDDLHTRLVTPALTAVVARLAGRPVPPGADTQLLLSLPHRTAWSLQGLNWHVDVAADPPDRLPGIQAFFLLDDVAPRGGATLAVAGSHRSDAARHVARTVLKAHADPTAPLAQEGMAIVEMAGRAGDVYLMDMRTLHTPSVNAATSPRLMATTRFLFGG